MSHLILKTTLSLTDFQRGLTVLQAACPLLLRLWLAPAELLLELRPEAARLQYLSLKPRSAEALILHVLPGAEGFDLPLAADALRTLLAGIQTLDPEATVLRHTFGPHAALSCPALR